MGVNGSVVFMDALNEEVILKIEPDGKFYGGSSDVALTTAGAVAKRLSLWLQLVEGEPVGPVRQGAGDFVFGVPGFEDALRICEDGRVKLGEPLPDETHDPTIYKRLSVWFAGSKVTLPSGAKGAFDMASPLAEYRDGVRFRFCSGASKMSKHGSGGDITLFARARLAQEAQKAR